MATASEVSEIKADEKAAVQAAKAAVDKALADLAGLQAQIDQTHEALAANQGSISKCADLAQLGALQDERAGLLKSSVELPVQVNAKLAELRALATDYAETVQAYASGQHVRLQVQENALLAQIEQLDKARAKAGEVRTQFAYATQRAGELAAAIEAARDQDLAAVLAAKGRIAID